MKLRTTEKGFTLVELLVGLSIAVLVVGAASMTIITMMRLTPQTNNLAIALRQVQNAGYWISRDAEMSGTITIGNGNPTFLTFKIPTGPASADFYNVDYRFLNMSGNLKRLMRVDGRTGQQLMIAEYIYYNPGADPNNSTKASYQSSKLNFTIAATSGKTVKRQYEATQRVK